MCLLKFVYRCACVLIVSYICCFSKVILYFVQLIRSSEWVWIWWVANYQHDLVYVAVWIHMLCFPMMWDNFTCCCIAEKELDEPLCTAQSSTIVDARRYTSTHSYGCCCVLSLHECSNDLFLAFFPRSPISYCSTVVGGNEILSSFGGPQCGKVGNCQPPTCF